VLALEDRVRDLEDVEDAHLDVLLELRYRARHPDEADLTLLLQRLELRTRVVLLDGGTRRAQSVQDAVEVVRPHPHEALLDAGPYVGSRELVGLACRKGHIGRLDRAAAIAREIELAAPMREVLPDLLFGVAVVGGRID